MLYVGIEAQLLVTEKYRVMSCLPQGSKHHSNKFFESVPPEIFLCLENFSGKY